MKKTFAQTRSIKDYDLCIEKKFHGEKNIHLIGYKKFLDLTEGSGYWKKGTALNELKTNGKLHTPFSTFTIDANQLKYIK